MQLDTTSARMMNITMLCLVLNIVDGKVSYQLMKGNEELCLLKIVLFFGLSTEFICSFLFAAIVSIAECARCSCQILNVVTSGFYFIANSR